MEVKGNYSRKKDYFQYPDELEYKDIKNTSILCANPNSKKERIVNAGSSNLTPHHCFEFTLTNGETKRMLIDGFWTFQKKKMLEIINEKNGLNFSYKTLERKDISIYARKKKKKNK